MLDYARQCQSVQNKSVCVCICCILQSGVKRYIMSAKS